MPDERRCDPGTRERLAAIQEGYERWAKTTFRALVIIAVGFVVTVAALGYLVRQNGKATDALCTLRVDLERRVDSSRDFLAKHPKGIPGINAATIRSGISNQQHTIDALAPLHC